MKEKIYEIVSLIIGVPSEELPDKEDYFEKFAVNSLKQMEIVDEIEDSFQIRLDLKENMQNIRHLDHLVEMIETLKKSTD